MTRSATKSRRLRDMSDVTFVTFVVSWLGVLALWLLRRARSTTPPPVSSSTSIGPAQWSPFRTTRSPGSWTRWRCRSTCKGAARGVTLTPGDRVRFRLAVKDGRSWVDRVEVVSAAPVDAGLQQTPATPVLVPVGSPMPDFELTDQAGRAGRAVGAEGQSRRRHVHLHALPAARLLPADGRELPGRSAQRFAARMDRDLVLLTISFDPKYDTPEMLTTLRGVAARRRAGLAFPDRRSARTSSACATRSGFSTGRRKG